MTMVRNKANINYNVLQTHLMKYFFLEYTLFRTSNMVKTRLEHGVLNEDCTLCSEGYAKLCPEKTKSALCAR